MDHLSIDKQKFLMEKIMNPAPSSSFSNNFVESERLAVFIDGANLYASVRTLGFDIDYGKLLTFFRTRGRLIRAYYYTAIFEENTEEKFSPLRPLVDWLDYNGYSVVTKPTKEYTDAHGRRKLKGNMDMELAIDMMRIAPSVDHIVLLSGDGDFRRLVQVVQQQGVRVSLISTLKTSPPMVSDDLRRQVDEYYDLDELREHITRNPLEPGGAGRGGHP